MTPAQEDAERLKLEGEAAVFLAAALTIADRAAVDGYINNSDRDKALNAIMQARALGYDFVAANAITQQIAEIVKDSDDSNDYALLLWGYMHDYSRGIVAELSDGRGLIEAQSEAQTVLRARKKWRVDGYAVDTVHQAVELAKYKAVVALDAGITLKTWRTVGDARVRRTHQLADGQKVPLASSFVVGGYRLMFPRDFTAPASQTAGCRCSTVYSTKWSK